MTRRWLAATLLVTLTALSDPRAATRPLLASTWRTAEIVIDGADFEWTDTLAPLPGVPASVSVANDDSHIYVRVRVTDPATMQQVVRGGLFVWFDTRGGEAKAFGVKYPVGTPPPNPDADDRGGRGTGRSGGGAGAPPAGRRSGPPPRGGSGRGAPVTDDLMSLVPNRLEIHGPKDDDIRSLVLAYATGLSVALSTANNALVYELRVPLKKDADHPFAVGASAGATIGIGVQSLKIAATGGGWLPALGQMSGGGMGGGRPGGGAGGGRPTNAPAREPSSDDEKDRTPPAPPRPFAVWHTLTLARM